MKSLICLLSALVFGVATFAQGTPATQSSDEELVVIKARPKSVPDVHINIDTDQIVNSVMSSLESLEIIMDVQTQVRTSLESLREDIRVEIDNDLAHDIQIEIRTALEEVNEEIRIELDEAFSDEIQEEIREQIRESAEEVREHIKTATKTIEE